METKVLHREDTVRSAHSNDNRLKSTFFIWKH